MINSFITNMNIKLCLFLIILNISLSIQDYKTFDLKIPLNKSELEPFFIFEYKLEKKFEGFVPSLINPIFLIGKTDNISNTKYLENLDFELYYPLLPREDHFKVQLFSYELSNEIKLLLAKPIFDPFITKRYFGLSSGLSNYSN